MNPIKKAAGIAASLALLFATAAPVAYAHGNGRHQGHQGHQRGHQGHQGHQRGHHGSHYGYGHRGYGYGQTYRRGHRHRHSGSRNYCYVNHSYSSGYGGYGYNGGYNSGYGYNGYRDRNSGYSRGYSSGHGYNNGYGQQRSRYQVGGRYGYGSHSIILSNYGAYGLYAPPRGYHWVRDRDRRDAILCSVATGAIIGLAVGVLNEY